jgi:5-carboxyvanillate decarboxylase
VRHLTSLSENRFALNTHGEYLDDPKYWDIFAAAEALDVPIYIHRRRRPTA